MKFGEKLTELRKKEGLSQEELGYKLNVTRQTVSKWELGQTTPEMDKLVELGKIFNISVDELVNETEKTANENEVIQDAPVKDKSPRNDKKSLIIIIAIVAIFVVVVISMFSIPFKLFGTIFNKMTNSTEDIYNKVTNSTEDIYDKAMGIFDEASNKIIEGIDSTEQKQDDKDTEMFNKVTGIIDGTIDSMKQEQDDKTSEMFDKITGIIEESIERGQ